VLLDVCLVATAAAAAAVAFAAIDELKDGCESQGARTAYPPLALSLSFGPAVMMKALMMGVGGVLVLVLAWVQVTEPYLLLL
jgi:hypothetical protein